MRSRLSGITRVAMIEGTALFSIVGLILLHDAKQLVLFVLCILVLSLNTVTKEKVIRQAKPLPADGVALLEQVKQFQREIKSQESSMEKLKRISANPVALANKNKSLEDQLSKVTSTNKLLAEENEHLKDASAKDWFILGASVSLGSLLFGLLITRINWKRKRHSWGDF